MNCCTLPRGIFQGLFQGELWEATDPDYSCRHVIGLATVLIQFDSCGMPASISINPFPLNLCFHIDCAFIILMMKLFCRTQCYKFSSSSSKFGSSSQTLFTKHLIFTPCMDYIKLRFLTCIDKISHKWLSSHPGTFSSDCDPAMAVEGKVGNKHICCLNEQLQKAWKNIGLYPCSIP